jgi:hypothetical protein
LEKNVVEGRKSKIMGDPIFLDRGQSAPEGASRG